MVLVAGEVVEADNTEQEQSRGEGVPGLENQWKERREMQSQTEGREGLGVITEMVRRGPNG